MWIPTEEEIAYYKRLGQNPDADDAYYADMLPLLLEHVNEECTQTFSPTELPGNVRLFLANAVTFYSNASFGLKSESVDDVTFSYDFDKLPGTLTGLLAKYGYGRSGMGARFHVF